MKIEYTPEFHRMFKKLPGELKLRALDKELIFRRDMFDPRLKTHKLVGKLKNYWSFSINYSYRILFSFGPDDIIYFHTVGDHDIYA